MKDFAYYLIRFIENNPNHVCAIADFVYLSSPDSYFGNIRMVANDNGINLYDADIETWKALVDLEDRTES